MQVNNVDEDLVSGVIPSELGNLTKLLVLDLTYNGLTGTIPPELGRLGALVELRLAGNKLTGEIPGELTKLGSLRELHLSGNQLSGRIPAGLGSINGLVWIGLTGNHLTGGIPKDLGNLESLRALQLGYNELTGEIPVELANIPTLEYLSLNENELTGEIPPDLGNLENLKLLQLSNNLLSGQIPATLSRLSSLETLYLDGNELSGQIPPELGMLPELVLLELASNDLGGRIPPELGNIPKLKYLKLSENQLTGEIPTELGMLSFLQTLDLDDNQLTGEIPEEFGNLSNLFSLGLRNNQIEGEIPQFFGALPGLWGLFLSRNQLTGGIPSSLAQLSNLIYLELNHNRLSGEIPPALEDLSSLLGFLVHDNDLTGCVPPKLGRIYPGDFSGTDLRFCFARDDDQSLVPIPKLTVNEGGPLTIEEGILLANDEQTGDFPLRITDVAGGVNGTVSRSGNMIIFQHNGSETTTGSFSYVASDTFNGAIAKVRITVLPVNDPPTAGQDNFEVVEGGSVLIEVNDLLDNDTDAEGDPIQLTGAGEATNGRVSLDGSTITYRHDGSEYSLAEFTYKISDGMDSNTGSVRIKVLPVNDPPEVLGETASMDGGESLLFEASSLLANDTDAENDLLRISAVGGAVNGTVSLEGTNITYRHDGSKTTEGGFSYTVFDGAARVDGIVKIEVTPINHPPRAVGDTATVEEGGRLLIQPDALLANDSDEDDDRLSFESVSAPVNGSVVFDGTTIVYEHDGSETTVGGFTYVISDIELIDEAKVRIDVSPINDPPKANADRIQILEGGSASLNASELLGNDTDVDSQEIRVTSVGGADYGVVSMDGAIITFEHDGSETAEARFEYILSDGSAEAKGEVEVEVSPVDDPPLAVSDRLTVEEGGTVIVASSTLVANDSDPDSEVLRLTNVGNGKGGIVRQEDTSVIFDHDGSEGPTAAYTYTISDGTSEIIGNVLIEVRPVNDPPVTMPDRFEVERSGGILVGVSELLANDADAEGDVLRVTAVGSGVNGSVQLHGSIVAYEHDGSESELGGFGYSVTDGKVESAGTVTIVVTSPKGNSMLQIIGLSIGVILLVLALAVLVALRMRRSGAVQE